jgi:hypothetical protein
VVSAERLEEIARAEIATASERYAADLQRQVERGNLEEARGETRTQITAVEAEELRLANAAVATLQLQAIGLERRRRLEGDAARAAERALEAQAGDLQRRQEVVSTQSQMAKTAAQQRTLELELLDLQMREQRLRLRGLIAAADRVLAVESTASAEQRIQAAAEREAALRNLEQVDRLEPARRAAVLNDTRGPAEEYMDSLRRTSGQLGEEFEQIAVNGVKRLEDQLTSTIAEVFHLGGAFGEVANQIIGDLIRIAVQRQVIAPLADILFGPASGQGQGGGGGGGLLAGLARMGQVVLGGRTQGALKGSGAAIGMATGGHIIVGGNGGVDRNELSINGEPVARVSQGERINVVPQGKVIQPISGPVRSRSSGGGLAISIHVDAKDAVLTHSVRQWVRDGVEEAVGRGTANGVAMSERRAFRRMQSAL